MRKKERSNQRESEKRSESVERRKKWRGEPRHPGSCLVVTVSPSNPRLRGCVRTRLQAYTST